MSKIRPLSNKILVLPDPKMEVTEGGILIPGAVQDERPRSGTVKFVGSGNVIVTEDGKWARVPLEVKEGDRVLFPPIDLPTIEVEGEELALMVEDQILAIL